MSESAEHPGHTCHGEVSPGKGPIGPDHCDGCEYETEMGQLRAEVERLRAKVTELSDEAYGYAEQVERLEEWQRQMVQKAADNSLDGYRELGAKCASLEERAEKAERERDAALKDADHLRAGERAADAAMDRLERERDEANQKIADMEDGLRKDNGSMIAYWFYEMAVRGYKKSLGAERAKRKKAERKAKRAASPTAGGEGE